VVHGRAPASAPSGTPSLLVVSSSGALLWSADTAPTTLPAAPASVAGTEVLVAASGTSAEYDAKLHRYSLATGSVLPAVDLLGASSNGVAIDEAGDVLTAADDLQRIHAGAVAWTYQMVGTGLTGSNPAIAPDGTIYVAGRGLADHYIHAVDPNGTGKWKQELTDATVSPIAVDEASRVYVVDGSGWLWVFESSGSLAWKFELPSKNSGGGVIVGPDHTVYVGTLSRLPKDFTGEYMYAVREAAAGKGELVWSVNVGRGFIPTTPALSAGGTLYVTDFCRELFALDAATGRVKWSFLAPGLPDDDTCAPMSSPTIGEGGTVYVSVESNGESHPASLFALDGDGTGPAVGTWSMEGADPSHSHRLAKKP